MTPTYTGRFAPSPTGPLHFGSLVSALVSYLDARKAGGQWLVRIEDLDPPREMAGAADTILRQLEQHGLQWDGVVLYQSTRTEAYLAALETLQQQSLLFPCTCTRHQLQASGGLHLQPCRQSEQSVAGEHALRIRAGNWVVYDDLFQGSQRQDIAAEVGDFVLRRKDGLFAYQLAVVVDDAFQNITHVIRGNDLLDSTPRQIYLQQLLGYGTPAYGHHPLVLSAGGQKLSKQNLAPAVDMKKASENLCQAMAWIGMKVPAELRETDCAALLKWGVENWDGLPDQ